MAHWDYLLNRVVFWPTRDSLYWKGWEEIDCKCCNGTEWGGDYPRVCKRCEGLGTLYRHKKTGVLAVYPGGPFRGKLVAVIHAREQRYDAGVTRANVR